MFGLFICLGIDWSNGRWIKARPTRYWRCDHYCSFRVILLVPYIDGSQKANHKLFASNKEITAGDTV